MPYRGRLSGRVLLQGCVLVSLALFLCTCGLARTASPVPSRTSTPPPAAALPPTATRTPTTIPTTTPTAIPTATPTPTATRRGPRTCLDRAIFGDRAASPYVLPYPVGASYTVGQSYCSPYGSHRNQLAYDFDMPVGDDVTAARGGMVILVREDVPDTGSAPYEDELNYVFIQHDDGTVAFYAHLKQDSVTVRLGERVEIGQRIAASGNSGNTGGTPHLHFGVYASWPPEEGFDVPVNFRNATAPGGLLPGEVYQALPYGDGGEP